jgi:hypothetical protein
MQLLTGQLELTSTGRAFAPWPNGRIMLAGYTPNRVLRRPMRQSRAADKHVLDGPMRPDCLHIPAHELSPCDGLNAVAYGPRWANPNSSARAAHCHHGPTHSEVILLTESYAGSCDSVV